MDYRKIIIVGETNIGRSFMAECILRGILQKRNCQNIEVVSRGLVVLFSEPVAPGAAKILREKGYGRRSCISRSGADYYKRTGRTDQRIF